MSLRKHHARRWLGALAGASVAVSFLGAGYAAAGADPALPQSSASMLTPVPLSATVAQEVLDEVATAGNADFWVHFDARPDLSRASQIADWDARGQAVYDALTETAAESQTDAVASLRASGAQFETFHISNAIKVEGGTSTTVSTLSALSGVDAIYPSFEVVPPDVVKEQASGMVPHAVAWGVADIGAPAVWDLGITGEHIVVATIDTGAQWDHPALVGSYRGNNGNGTFDHNYNWFDAAGTSAGAPADGNGHGTHVTGTMVGDDGGANQIGVAPGATWIAANGCCPTDAALLRSGEWMLAPTDLLGANPDPALRPHVINNSWGSTLPSNDPFLEDISAAWAAAGQFGVFANGNNGPACNTSTSPGSRAINYSVGNYNSAHTIGALSSRGAGQGGAIKPDISAPGTAIYSALPGGGYGTLSGTSMASPHVAGAVALLWSASPTLRGDVAATRALLDSTAADTEDLQCGGTAAHNNVHGEGRLDVVELIAHALDQLPPQLLVDRLSGLDRYGTAVAISQELHQPGVDVVYVATGTGYADALAGTALAGSHEAPVLLTPGGSLSPGTAAELDRLDPGRVVLLGGTASISEQVADLIGTAANAPVTRLAGGDRYATAAAIAGEFTAPDIVFVASGEQFADALAGAARAGALDAPVLLVRPNQLPPATAAALTALAPSQIRLLGGEGAVSAAVATALGGYGAVTRIAGDDRYATAAAITADYPSAQTGYLASGLEWPDALAGGALAAATGQPLLLSRHASIPTVIGTELQRLRPTRVVLLGGEAAVAPAIVTALHELLP